MTPNLALSLHHVGYAVKSIDPIAASYVSRYGYELSTPAIHDPIQTAFVQFLKLPADSTYFEIVAPDGPESILVDAVKHGGGLNDLCYIAGQLEETIAYLEQCGMCLISEPKPGASFAERRICWLLGSRKRLPIELVERRDDKDLCQPASRNPTDTDAVRARIRWGLNPF